MRKSDGNLTTRAGNTYALGLMKPCETDRQEGASGRHRLDEEALLAALAATTSPEVMKRLLTDILTPAEYATLCRRWSILRQLHEGRTQRAVAADLHASLCNVTRGARILRDSTSAAAQLLGDEPAP